uniref:hypothetical protein n=1 Tax=Acetatifactor sp. TaxID=1872090 RepID=UPI004056959F
MPRRKQKDITENPLYHNTWKILQTYQDVVWSIGVSIKQLIDKMHIYIQEISYRTYFRKRQDAIDALSSILWGYTSKDFMEVLEHFFLTRNLAQKWHGNGTKLTRFCYFIGTPCMIRYPCSSSTQNTDGKQHLSKGDFFFAFSPTTAPLHLPKWGSFLAQNLI